MRPTGFSISLLVKGNWLRVKRGNREVALLFGC
jgi:hypothetical protein